MRSGGAFVSPARGLPPPGGTCRILAKGVAAVAWFLRPHGEMRAAWVPYWELTAPEKVEQAVARAGRAGLNTLFVHARARGDAYYRSALAPRAEGIADPAFDPLQHALDLCGARGIAVHAWFNALLVWSRATPPASPQHLLNARRDWLMVDPAGQVQGPARSGAGFSYEGGYYLDPAVPAVGEHLAAVALELVRRYPVAGIHLDYIRHPGRVGPGATRLSYTPAALARFRQAFAGLCPAGGALEGTPEWDQWREDQVTGIVRRLALTLAGEPRRVQLSAACLARFDVARGRCYTTGTQWVRDGYLDFVCPMSYFSDAQEAHHYNDRWLEADRRRGRRVVPGLGAFVNAPGALARQIANVRRLGCGGFALFSITDLTDPYIQALTDPGGPLAGPAGPPPPVPVRPLYAPPPAAIPRRNAPVVMGDLRAGWFGGWAGFNRDFYSVRGQARLRIAGRGLMVLQVRVNGQAVSVPAGAAAVDLAPYLGPAAPRLYADPHTHRLEVQAALRGWGARARLWIEDLYEPEGGAP